LNPEIARFFMRESLILVERLKIRALDLKSNRIIKKTTFGQQGTRV
jgi:hypothetical protein